MQNMKLKVMITGPRVHDVGYNPFLAEIAISLGLRGFEAYYDEDGERQVVVALLQGDSRRVARFCDFAMKDKPQIAEVDELHWVEFSGDVMPLWQFASIITAYQMNKAVQILSGRKSDGPEKEMEIKSRPQKAAWRGLTSACS